ncbi:alanine--tRNA ligase [Candidatus Odyssella acanthamoebae]|uniref:Alanine--tRNA ligase n=1 Tax=Candidatus Odyssella acanthamoebae TaxID=91604 RepID=A0A077AYM9_9PROT|nr:alanine--tRNA ligase [Candidatus Paracaedibacter acanthamoebae]AIK97104.1 alanyl-tRNA synthetase [Candidatus Paracaedibacter acanthamoebae]
MHTLADIRSTFLNFFKDNHHEVVASSPLVPSNDPTLLFTNAGMVQFKDVFTGMEKRPYTRATTSQKCVRAGGKHNDLENVGYTARHHTFFEMLGNFSFGDYFKEEAIYFAWQLVTKNFGLTPDRLLVTVYHEDEEAATLWKKIAGLPDHKIIRITTSDNFWSMGDTGPCGPCTEIFYDHGEGIAGGPPGSPDQDGDRFTEFWNLVFMQYEQLADGTRVNLPKPSVDTGMGLERFATIMQGVHNNYDTDLFKSLIEASADLTGTAGALHRHSHNVVADHLRASAFLLADGVLPSNEGRGYVLRRIMRRAMRHAHLLGAKEPLMCRLVNRLVELMGSAYPDLTRAQAMITENLKLEEERFRQTLDRGLRLLEEETAKLGSTQALPGDVAFRLYDTYGFPLDLTQDVLRGQNRDVELAGFNTAMDAQKAAARANWAGSGDTKNEQIWFDLHQQLGATEFLGYETESAEGVIQAIVVDGKTVNSVQTGQKAEILFNQTPFYAESGGQEGDKGIIEVSTGGHLTVLETSKHLGSLDVHHVLVTTGSITVGDTAKLMVDSNRRQGLRAHHSATHLLHAALRHRLGDHVTQKGSLVAEDRLRFDFTHTKPLSMEDLQAIEQDVNLQILANTEVETHLMSSEEAIAKGAMALFGEKYGEEVRVLTMGQTGDKSYSVELCGGTHAHRTGDIGLFKILSEAGVSAGVRRIEAIAGMASLGYLTSLQNQMNVVAATLKSPVSEAQEKIEALLTERKTLERQVADLRQKLALSGANGGRSDRTDSSGSATKSVGNIKVITRQLTDIPAKDLKPLADQLKTEVGSGVVILTSVVEGKVALVIGVTNDLTTKISAVDLVRHGAEALGGKGGGGRPDMAQAGGNNPAQIAKAITAIEAALS